MNNLPLRKIQFFQILILLLALGVIAAYSSSKPDGLEKILQIFDLEKAFNLDHNIPFADYVISPGFPEILNQFLSALLGMSIIMVLVFFIYKISSVVNKRNRIDNAT